MARLGMLRIDVDDRRTIFVEASLLGHVEALGDRTIVHLRGGEWFASEESAEAIALRYDRLVAGLPAEPGDVNVFGSPLPGSDPGD